jgi:hypothetical protein
MKRPIIIIATLTLLVMTTSCNLFKPKYGCPSNGKNVGAERLMGDDPKAEKAAKKAGKFKG